MTLEEALHTAADERGLQVWYRDLVRPLLRDPEGRWPRCCGAQCEPCAQLLVGVAARTLVLLGTPRLTPHPDLR
jgi:hypothetical protein